jgi:tRNA(fMet)-specific endonuclease VapC
VILLLDTNICIYLIKKHPTEVLRRFEEYEVGDIGISSITAAELHFGAQKSQQPDKNLQALEQFLLPLAVVPFGGEAVIAYGRLRAHLEKQGTPIGSLDTLIAAHALGLDLTLVTNNLREFERVPDLKVENWVAA